MSLTSDAVQFAQRHGLFDGVRTVVVGLSGGPDSVCLADLLAHMSERGDATLTVHAAHLNHGLRGAEADADEQFVREFACSRGLPLSVEQRDVEAARAEEGGSVEEAARRIRYAFLASVAVDVGAEAVAVGHTADDQIETVLHRLVRGTGLKGLRGMAPSRPLAPGSAVRLIRPLLDTRRAEVLDALRGRGLSFREDSSNRDVAFLRNRIRHELLPDIEAGYNPTFGEALLRLSRSAAEVYELVRQSAHAAANRFVCENEIALAAFHEASGAVLPLLIDRATAEARPGAPQFDAKHYDAVAGLARTGKRGARIELPGGVTATRTEDAVVFACGGPAEAPRPVDVRLCIPGRTAVPALGLAVTADVLDRAAFDLGAFLAAKTRYDEALDADAAPEPLVLRTRRDGDVFRPLGAGGRKKVGKFLTNLKVSQEERGRIPVVAAGGKPVWVVGCRIDERVKVTEGTTRVLKLSVTREE